MLKQDQDNGSGQTSAWAGGWMLPLLKRYVQFCLVGATGMAVDMGLLHLLVSPGLLGWDLSLSKAIAAEVALINNFVWNELWTFRARGEDGSRSAGKWWERLLKFNLICMAGIGLSVVLLNLQVRLLGLNVYLANFIAIVVASLWNFWLSLRFGWKIGRG